MSDSATSFEALAIAVPLLRAIKEIGYESPTPIQAKSIPCLLAGNDLLGQAQTGTGKTAAFAIPILSRIELIRKEPQALVLVPTRELALQVAEAFQSYAKHLKGFHVLPIYGGQSMEAQLRQLRRGVHVIVGTPGRVMDHLRRKSLSLKSLTTLVLDEADEMLKMGFIEEVEWILTQTPAERQIALFSATLPEAIRKVARHHLRAAQEVKIEAKTVTVASTSQHYWPVYGVHKLDALTRILEVEDFDAMIIFVRTKTETTALAEKLEARGYAVEALNGDMSQALRERVIERLKKKALDIVVATDVAARGLDVERISHVVNYDIPYDADAYIHRIGRTGRAGRAGKAILFVAPRERRMLSAIEKATKQRIKEMQLPTHQDVAERRIEQFKHVLATTLEDEELGFYRQLASQFVKEQGVSALDVAAALTYLAQRERPFLVADRPSRGEQADKPAKPESLSEKRRERVSTGEARSAGTRAYTAVCEDSEHRATPDHARATAFKTGSKKAKKQVRTRAVFSPVDLPPSVIAGLEKLRRLRGEEPLSEPLKLTRARSQPSSTNQGKSPLGRRAKRNSKKANPRSR